MELFETKEMLKVLKSVFPKIIVNDETPLTWHLVFQEVSKEDAMVALTGFLKTYNSTITPTPAMVYQHKPTYSRHVQTFDSSKYEAETGCTKEIILEFRELKLAWIHSPRYLGTSAKDHPDQMKNVDAWRDSLGYAVRNDVKGFEQNAPKEVLNAMNSIGGLELVRKQRDIPTWREKFYRAYSTETNFEEGFFVPVQVGEDFYF